MRTVLLFWISDTNLSAFIYRLLHEDFSSIAGCNTVAGIQGMSMVECQQSIVLIPTIKEKSS